MSQRLSPPILYSTQIPDAKITQHPGERIRLEIPAGPAGRYRLAQLDDYQILSRQDFKWHAPIELSLTASVSSRSHPGTWGFGLWNDPFSLVLPGGARRLRLPALPNAAWFFFASPENYLSLRNDQPAQGNLAAVFRSPRLPGLLTIAAAPFLPFLSIHPFARILRRLGSKFINQASTTLSINPEEAHHFCVSWEATRIQFQVDGKLVLSTGAGPQGPLGIVIWLDNQYAAWQPSGKIAYGTLGNPVSVWIDIVALRINGQLPMITLRE